jgi:hypothetical protein
MPAIEQNRIKAPEGTHQMLQSIDKGILGGVAGLRRVDVFQAMGLEEDTLSIRVKRRLRPPGIFPYKSYEFLIDKNNTVTEVEGRVVNAKDPDMNLEESPKRLLSDALVQIRAARKPQQ